MHISHTLVYIHTYLVPNMIFFKIDCVNTKGLLSSHDLPCTNLTDKSVDSIYYIYTSTKHTINNKVPPQLSKSHFSEHLFKIISEHAQNLIMILPAMEFMCHPY